MHTCQRCGKQTYFAVGFCSPCQDIGIAYGNVDTLIDLALNTMDKRWFLELARKKKRFIKAYGQGAIENV